MLIDTHNHLYDELFDPDRPAVIDRARAAGVKMLFLPAIDSGTHEALFDLCRKYPALCFPMMGLHPTSVNDNPAFRLELRIVEDYLDTPPPGIRFRAVGEVGLDLYWSRDFRDEQIEALRFQIELALRHDLPLVIHTRDAWNEMCALLSEYTGRGLKGILHSFSGELEHYRSIREMGDFLFGIGGPVTYKNSKLADLFPAMELSDLVLETDAPYLPPVPHRGQRNEPAYLIEISNKVAELKRTAAQEVARITSANALRMFGFERAV